MASSLDTVSFSLEAFTHDFSLPSQDLPDSVSYPQLPPIKGLLRMEVQNFKSFVGQHPIGPYLSNTAIVGPNGSGKSNIIDAICFVFGISVSSLRSSSLKDLVNKGFAGASKKAGREVIASVILEIALENNEILELKRTIDNKFKSELFINGDAFHWLYYSRFLQMNHLNTNPASFLILQSETYSMIEKKPKELMDYFERMCGSFELREKYMELKSSLETLQNEIKENTCVLNSMKGERKKLRQQLQYSEEYRKLVDDLDILETSMYGLTFLKLDLILGRKGREFIEKMSLLDEERKTQEKERLEKQKRALQFKKRREEMKKIEESLNKKKKELAENRIELSKLNEESSYSGKLLAGKELSVKRLEEEYTVMKANFERLTAQEAEMVAELQEIEKQLEVDESKNEASGKVKKNFNEYLQFQKEAEVKLQSLKLELQKFRSHEKKILERLAENKKGQESVASGLASTELKLKEFQLLTDTNQKNYAELTKSHQKLSSEFESLSKKINASSEKREKLLQLKAKKETLLSDAQSLINSMLDLREKNELFYELRTIKGFREDISTLLSALRPEYDLPLRIALGPALDYLVVDSMEVAKSINAILRERGLQKDVLILENIPKASKHIDASLIGNHGLLAENTVSFRREITHLDEAVAFLLNGIIICETAKEAKALKAIFKKRNAMMPKQIITQDGLVIREGFLTTFGDVERMKESSRRLNKLADQKSVELRNNKEQEIEKIKLELKRNEEEIKEFNTNNEEKELRNIEGKLQETKAKVVNLENEFKGLKDLKKGVEQQFKSQEENLRKLQVEKAKLEKELLALREEIKGNEANYKKEQNLIYKPLLQKLKISDVSEIKGKDYEELDKLYEKKLVLTKSLEGLRLELKNNKAAVLETNIKNIKTSMENEAKVNETLQRNLKKLEKAASEINQELDSLKEELTGLQAQINAQESEEGRTFELLRQMDEGMAQHERELREIEQLLHQNLNKKQQLCEELKIKSVNLKFSDRPSQYDVSFQEVEEKLFPKSGRNQRKQTSIHIDYAALRMVGMLKMMLSNGNAIEEEKDLERDNEEIKKIIKKLDPKTIERKLEEMETEIKTKSDLIEEYTSNMIQNSYSNTFNEKMTKFEDKAKELGKKQDSLLEMEKKVSQEFEANKKQRSEKFIAFFEQVKKLTDEIYKTLTKTDKTYDVGGTALLYLENQNDPFNGGIIYSPTPPNKRYVYDSEQLSGGEKTMGGLALLFALNIAAKTKFMIFDETDAFLDPENSQRFMEFIKEISNKGEMQIILVSHKKNFYENAKSLIGVTYSSRVGSSQAFSLDLSE